MREPNKVEHPLSIWKDGFDESCIEESKYDEGERHPSNSGRGDVGGTDSVTRHRKERTMKSGRSGVRKAKDRSGLGKRRVRRRRMVAIDQFILLEKNTILGLAESSSIMSGLSETDKFMISIGKCMLCVYRLTTEFVSLPFLRCCGGRRRNQKYVSVSTVRIKHSFPDGTCRLSALLTVFVVEESRRIRNLTLRTEMEKSQSVSNARTNRSNLCSCEIPIDLSDCEDSRCWHMDALKRNSDFMQIAEEILICGLEEDQFMYFGDWLEVEERQDGNVSVKEGKGIDGLGDGQSMESKGLIAIQLYNTVKEDMVQKGRKVAKVWCPWCVVDVVQRLVVSVIWRLVLKGIETTRINCVMCRHDASRKCRHEIVCELESYLCIQEEEDEDVTQLGNGSGFQVGDDGNGIERGISSDEYNEAEDTFSVHGGDPVCEENGAIESTMGGVDSNGVVDEVYDEIQKEYPDGLSDRTPRGRAINIPKSTTARSYYPVGVRRSSFFLCEEETKKTEKLTDFIETEVAEGGALTFGDPEGQRCGGICMDGNGNEARCEEGRKDYNNDVSRKMKLFTLNHGQFTILVLDWVCTSFGNLNLFRGESHGIYPAAFGVAYTVELMHFWIDEMCSNTRSFRDLYQTTAKLHRTASYMRRFNTDRLTTLRLSHRPNRRTDNYAIRQFIMDIEVERSDISDQLFSCSKCEVEMGKEDFEQLGLNAHEHAGTKCFKSVVIDAKAMSLLKEGAPNSDVHDVLSGVTGLN